MILAEAIGHVLDLAMLTDQLEPHEETALPIVARWVDRQINTQTGSNTLLGDRLISDLVECDHPHHDDLKCPACSGSGRCWKPACGWSNRAAFFAADVSDVGPDIRPSPYTELSLWDDVA